MTDHKAENGALSQTVAALADDEDLMWRMGVREWDIVGDISTRLRAEVIRQSREHVANLAAALSNPPEPGSP